MVENTVKFGFVVFKRLINFDVSDSPRSGSPSGFKETFRTLLTHADQHQSARDLADI